MKKIISASVLFLLVAGLVAQESANSKNFRFGLKTEPSFNWLKPDDVKKMNGGGLKIGAEFGAVLDFKLGENIWFSSGIGLDFNGAKMTYLKGVEDSIGYFYANDGILSYSEKKHKLYNQEGEEYTGTSESFVVVKSRNMKINYLNIPLYLKMKTKEIGYLTYYGQFGMLASIKTKARTTDEGFVLGGGDADLNQLNVDKEVSLVKSAAVIGIGAEYNISGSTSAFFSLTYNYGFTGLLSKTSDHLIDQSASSVTTFKSYNTQKIIPHAIRLSVGILF